MSSFLLSTQYTIYRCLYVVFFGQVVKMVADIYYERNIETSEYEVGQKDANNKPNEQRQIQLLRAKVSASWKAGKVKT